MQYCFARFLILLKSTFITFILCITSTSIGFAQQPTQASPAMQLAQELRANPENRRARWAFSQLAFQAERYDIARYHVQYLLRTSSSEQDIETLSRALAEITSADPWDVDLSFALLPSSNIRRLTYNDEFETVLGIFTPTGGGNVESGIGLTFGAGLSYGISMPDKSSLSFRTRVDRSTYSVSDLNRTRLLLSLAHESFDLGYSTVVEPFIRFRYDDRMNLDRQDIGVNFSRNWLLENSSQLLFSAVVEDRDYRVDEVLSGPYGRFSLRQGFEFNDNYRIGLGASVARSEPQRGHLKYWEGQLSADATRIFENIGLIGVFGRYTDRNYDDVFPATTLIREDETFTIGLSYQHNTFEILRSRPRISCQIERNTSNIALYDYESTDCGLTFNRAF